MKNLISVRKKLVQRNVVKKKCCSKKYFVQKKNFDPKKFVSKKIFGPQKFFRPDQIFASEKNFGP